jgi:hypothetical protein
MSISSRNDAGLALADVGATSTPTVEGIGLDDDTEATFSLLVTITFGEAEGRDVTPTHGGSP